MRAALVISGYTVMALAMAWGGLSLALRKLRIDLFKREADEE